MITSQQYQSITLGNHKWFFVIEGRSEKLTLDNKEMLR
jgi:hypothetical protein